MATVPKIIVPNPGGVTSLSDGAAAFPISEGSYTTGTTRDGIRYVVAPNGIIITTPTPAQANVSGREKNGVMLNPERIAASLDFQAFDNFDGCDLSYDHALQATFPLTLRPGDCLVKAVSTASPEAGGRDGVLDQFAGLHVVASAPAANAFAAPFIWPAADKASRPWRVVDVDARLAELPSLSASGLTTNTWAQLSQYWDRMNLSQALTSRTSAGGYEYITINNFCGLAVDNYEQNQNRMFQAVYMGLMLNQWSSADKTAALIRLLQNGCQVGETLVKDNGTYPNFADGGHHRTQYAPAMTWLWGTGRQDQYATWVPLVGGSVLAQVVKLDAAFLATCAVHSDINKPYPWRRREVITSVGTAIRVEAYTEGGTNKGDGTNPNLTRLRMKRESDGATALCTATVDVQNTYIDITIDAQPGSPFLAGDVVYFEPTFSLVTDDWDFVLADAATWNYNPSPDAPYRGQTRSLISHLWCHAIGMHGSLMDGPLAYSEKSMLANTPASGYDYPSDVDEYGPGLHGRAGNEAQEQQFYDAHGATLLALPQDV